MPVSAVHTVLRNRIYTGDFIWKGQRYRGRHQPLISADLYERVQAVIDGRQLRKTRRFKHDFAFATLITCGHCGCALVGELKKKRYVYYHCTGYKGDCAKPYVREEVLCEQFSSLLGRLRFEDEVLAWLSQGLRESHADEAKEHEEAIARLQAEYGRLQSRLHAVYIDKLDGRMDTYFFDKLSDDWRREQDRCLREIARHQQADRSYIEEGIGLLEMAGNAQRLFAQEPPLQKRRLLNFVLSNCSWSDGELRATFRQPFDLLAETAAIAAQVDKNQGPILGERSGWLGN